MLESLLDVLEDSVWLDLIYFLTSITFWLVKYLFGIDGDNLGVLAAKDLIKITIKIWL